jgi:D-arabinitol 4-dehydrogenase
VNWILHLGLGSFHRAHQAVYLHRLMEQGELGWRIAAGNLRPDMADTIEALLAQQGQYTLETISPQGDKRYERITSIQRVVPFEPSLAGLIEIGADAHTRIISFTVTEAGYYLDARSRLDPAFADLRGDLEGTTRATIYGALTAILKARMHVGAGPVTLMNCDNLRSNGERFRAGMLDFLERRGEALLREWFELNTTCPNAMVDRITPRPGPEVAQRVHAATGWEDGAAVMGESFIQWVIEDHFAAGRPAWERVGAEMVTSVAAHEEAKIRILNAPHSCIAWAGSLRGLTYIHEGVVVPAIRAMAHAYVTDEVIPCLHTRDKPSPIDLARYRDVVLERFSNANLRDTNQRVAMDGFSKIPGFIVPTLRERLERGESIAATAMLPALFFAFLARWHRGELSHTYQDGVMDPTVAHAFFNAADPLAAFCHDPLLWGPLAGNPALESAIRAAHIQVEHFIAAGVRS